jgi:hypothetical protein
MQPTKHTRFLLELELTGSEVSVDKNFIVFQE